jgi:hypothetical protein
MTRYVKVWDDVLATDATYTSDGTPEGDAALASAVADFLGKLPAVYASPATPAKV